MTRTLSILIATCSLLGGCAGLTHLTRPTALLEEGGKPRAIMIDAKQRAIITATVPTQQVTYTVDAASRKLVPSAVEVKDQIRTCAETPPDALSAISASNSLGLSAQDKINLSQAASLAEGAGSIGLRTQSTELTKNPSYRLCEGYLMGALSEGAYETLTRRNQSSTVAILAIEQLTGAVRARQVVIGGSSAVGSAEHLLKATDLSRTAKATLDASKAELTSAEATADDLKEAQEVAQTAVDGADTATDEQKQALSTAKKKAEEQNAVVAGLVTKVSQNQDIYNKAEQARVAAVGSPTSATASASVASDGENLDATTVQAVSNSVEKIVQSALGLQFSNELCTTVLTGSAYGRIMNVDADVLKKCNGLLEETAKRHAARTAILVVVSDYIRTHPKMTADQVIKLLASNAIAEEKDGLMFIK